MILPCGENVLVRRELVSAPFSLSGSLDSDVAHVVAGPLLEVGSRVVLRPGGSRLGIGDWELVPLADVLAVIGE